MDKGMEKISMGYGYGQGEEPDAIRELENAADPGFGFSLQVP